MSALQDKLTACAGSVAEGLYCSCSWHSAWSATHPWQQHLTAAGLAAQRCAVQCRRGVAHRKPQRTAVCCAGHGRSRSQKVTEHSRQVPHSQHGSGPTYEEASWHTQLMPGVCPSPQTTRSLPHSSLLPQLRPVPRSWAGTTCFCKSCSQTASELQDTVQHSLLDW